MRYSGCQLAVGLGIVVSLTAQSAIATDDEYLKMLENEAEDLQLDGRGQIINSDTDHADDSAKESAIIKNPNWNKDLQVDVIPPSLSMDEFTAYIKQNFHGSYAFFLRLNNVDRQTIYSHYTKASPAYIDDIRQDILMHIKK